MNSKHLVLSALLLVACGASQAPNHEASPHQVSQPDRADSTDSFADQVQAGAGLYATHCAGCHGDSGQGDPGPAVVGLATGALPLTPPDAAKLRRAEFRTALDVFVWVKANMPPNKGGSLSDEEYISILAFDLKANGVDLSTPLDAASAKALVLHPSE